MSGATPPQNRGTVLVGANWTNNGFVDIAGGSVRTGGGILGGAIVNSGQLSGHGLVTATATNELGGVFGGGGASGKSRRRLRHAVAHRRGAKRDSKF